MPAALLETVQAPAGDAPQRATLYCMATGDQAWQPLQGGAQRNPTKYEEWQTGAREGAGSDSESAPHLLLEAPPPSWKRSPSRKQSPSRERPPSWKRGQAALHSRTLWTLGYISSTTSLRFSQQTRASEVVLGQSRDPSSLPCSGGLRACRGRRTRLQPCMCQVQDWRHQAQCPSLPSPPALKLSRTRMATAYSSASASHTTVLRKASAACIPYTEAWTPCTSGWVSVPESIPHLSGSCSDARGTKCPPPPPPPPHPRTWCLPLRYSRVIGLLRCLPH